jgi:hypothetical protein
MGPEKEERKPLFNTAHIHWPQLLI